MTGPAQDATLARFEREHVSRTAKILGFGIVLDGFERRQRALGGGNAGGRQFVVDGDGEGGLEFLGIGRHHLGKTEFLRQLARHGHADEAARIRRHKVDVFERRMFGGADDVAFIFTVFVVDNDDALALAEGFQKLGKGRKSHSG